MRKTYLTALGAMALAAYGLGGPRAALGQVPDNPPPGVVHVFEGPQRPGESRLPDFNTVVRGARVYDGLFRLHQKDDHLYMEIKPNQLNHAFLCPIAVARGGSMGGH